MSVKVNRISIDGALVTSMDGFYDELARKLPLPAHFGRNLDALWDVLTVDLEGPLEIIWQRADLSKKSLGREFTVIAALFAEVSEERDDFSFQLVNN
jgi:ribonuclease inhibitor